MSDKSMELFRQAASRGVLSQKSLGALGGANREITTALAGSYADTSGGDVILITMQLDDSESMAGEPERAVLHGHNDLMDLMAASPLGQRTLLQTRCLSGQIINPFSPFVACQRLDHHNYQANFGDTPLFRESVITLGAVLAKTEEQVGLGSKVRSGTLIMSDGGSAEPFELAEDAATLIADMRSVGDHIVAAMGFGSPDFYWASFRDMGIPPELIFSANDRESVVKAFRMFGSAVVELSAGKAAAVQVFGQ